ncbi:MAG: hypothetical protein COC24_010550 [Alphaproteobacteria bacterium]|nr:hypothetical protein [Alphaproteobacteria bacterium]
MSKNLKVVEIFIAEFYKNSSAGMVDLTSPSFSFTQNSGAKQTLENFINRMRVINHSAKFKLFEPTSQDDTHFYSEFELKIPGKKSSFVKALGRTKFVVKDELLQALDISYHTTEKEYNEFQALMNQSSVAFV